MQGRTPHAHGFQLFGNGKHTSHAHTFAENSEAAEREKSQPAFTTWFPPFTHPSFRLAQATMLLTAVRRRRSVTRSYYNIGYEQKRHGREISLRKSRKTQETVLLPNARRPTLQWQASATMRRRVHRLHYRIYDSNRLTVRVGQILGKFF